MSLNEITLNPTKSPLYIHIKPTNNYALLKNIIDKLVNKYNYTFEYINNHDWIFKFTNLNYNYQHFINELINQTKSHYNITHMDTFYSDKNLFIDFSIPSKNLMGKYRLNKYNEPEYQGERKSIVTIIEKMMKETFSNIQKGVHGHDKNIYTIGYSVDDISKMTIDDWRAFYHKIFFLQQIFLKLHIKISTESKDKKQLIKCLQEPDLLFKGKYFIEFKYPLHQNDMNNILNKIMKKHVGHADYFKSLPIISTYTESRIYILKNIPTEKQIERIKRDIVKYDAYKDNIKMYIGKKQVAIY